MEKEKRKGKPNRLKWIIAIALILIGACLTWSVYSINHIVNWKPSFAVSILQDVDASYPIDYDLIESRLLEHLTIGASTYAEVEVFADEHLLSPYNACTDFQPNLQENALCYAVERYQRLYFCYLFIHFIFENDILTTIEFNSFPSCHSG